jgi:uncharacterized BrkB/YihY/UPF0761 family membrane protein
MMFKWLSDTLVGWYDVWLGAILTSVFFEIGKFAIGFYIGEQGLESTYGAAASIIVVLIWVTIRLKSFSWVRRSPMPSQCIKVRLKLSE